MRELITPRDARQPQGRLRPRADRRRIARQDRRRASRGGRRAAIGRRARHRRDAGVLPGRWSRRWAPEYMTEALDETDGRARSGRRRSRARAGARRHRASAPASGRRRPRASSSRQLVDRATMPLVIDADGLNAFSRRSRIGWPAAKGATSSSRRIRARWRGWSGCRPTKCRRAASRSRATSPSRITSTSC